ncbi:phosphocholine-specific phospholipase C [Nocardia sp. NPDC051570]|uniref:phosphocholine-specific phospholipase C n=1 Tax=Nocardia sp. NPDC051570 TaxID=3364324 RepID=UPI00379C8E2D
MSPRSGHEPSRRRFLGGVAAAAGLAALLPPGSAEAVPPSSGRGKLDDLEHVVILMQENRSFDHYYGTMAGVRGFGDKTALRERYGDNVFHQPDPLRVDGQRLLPFRVDTTKVDGQDLADLLHDWDTTHVAIDSGWNDLWIPVKSEMTMAYFDEGDIPFHRALARAFTICDQYFCSIQGQTTPNRLYHWTGTIDPRGVAGGPVTYNPTDYQPILHWTTYPERLQAAGISWQVYANDEVGDQESSPFVGDYGDNPLWLFQAYHDALASPDPAVRQLAERGGLHDGWKPDSGRGKDVDHVIARFKSDCAAGTLPAVSWVVAPFGYTEHPAMRPVDGQAYVQGVLNALWADPELWSKTAVFINYDENDGFFDHVIPPMPPPGTADEYLPASQPLARDLASALDQLAAATGLPVTSDALSTESSSGSAASGPLPPAAGPPVPIGLGPRVPMVVVSPWSRGGWVNSEVFDHTSVLRFLERWTGVAEPNISPWRRSVCGDLLSCFDFGSRVTTIPLLPDTAAMRAEADALKSGLGTPVPPAPFQQVPPSQPPDRRPARPLPYQPLANVTAGATSISLALNNFGTRAVNLSVYAYRDPSRVQRFDVPPAATVSGSIPVTDCYDIAIHGPNGFLVEAAGNPGTIGLEATLALSGSKLELTLHNRLPAGPPVRMTITDHNSIEIGPGETTTVGYDPLSTAHGWYDITATVASEPEVARLPLPSGSGGTGSGVPEQRAPWLRRFAGHLENGKPSLTG